MRYLVILALLIIIAFAINCSKDHTDLPVGFKYDPPQPPTNLKVTPESDTATLTWSYPEDMIDHLMEFKVYYYIEMYDMLELIGTTTDTVFVDSLLIGNLEYCYTVSAVDSTNLESYRIDPVCEFIPSTK